MKEFRGPTKDRCQTAATAFRRPTGLVALISVWFLVAGVSSGTGDGGQRVQTVPFLPLVYEVLVAPVPVNAEGRYRLIYELRLSSFSRREVELRKIEVLADGQTPVKVYDGDLLSRCLTRPGEPPDLKDMLTLDGGSQAVLFVMVSFDSHDAIPIFLTHRVTAQYTRGKDQTVLAQGVGARVAVLGKQPLVINPPVLPGTWLAGNGPGDGPVGHRLSLQPWNGQLMVNERFAFDFMKFGPQYRLARGDGSKNADWFGYGQQVVAVADGTVSDCHDGIAENTPHEPYAAPNTMEAAAGNYVILDLGQGVYAVYAHLKPGSLKVEPGDRVRQGQVLGEIGNSGISDAPHLHFHLIDADSVYGGQGLAFVFERFAQLGPFDPQDDRPDSTWVPKGKRTTRELEMPLGDQVIEFPIVP